MKVEAKMKFLGAEKGTTREGKPYFYIGLLQGMESNRVYVDEDMYKSVANYKMFGDVQCALSISIGQSRSYVNLDNIWELPADGKNAVGGKQAKVS